MKAVVTGATSMLGVALIEECIAQGCEVLAIVRRGSERIKRIPSSRYVTIKCTSLEYLDEVYEPGEKYDVFYHFAWASTTKKERDNAFIQETNIKATLKAVELANKMGCKKFIGAGSQAEYGNHRGVIDAETIANPQTAYGIAKYSANLLSGIMCRQLGMTHIWTRIFSIYGIYDNEGTMLNYAIDQFIDNKVAKFTPATQIWNYLNAKDAGRMFFLLGKCDVQGGIYCIAHPESMRLRDYIEEMKSIYGEKAQCEYERNSIDYHPINLNVDISKTTEAINYIPQVSFTDGIKEVIQYRKGIRNK